MNFINKILLKIKNRYGILFPSLICLFTIINLIGTLWISSFIYEPNITNQFYMFSVMFFPLTSITIGVIVIIKFIVDAIMKKEGSHLKLVIVFIMGLMTVLPSMVISKISTYIIKTNLNLFLDESINSSVEYVIDISNREIIDKQEFMSGIIEKVGINYFNNLFYNLGTGYSEYEDISQTIKSSEYFNNIVFLSNSYNANNIIFLIQRIIYLLILTTN